MVMHRSLTPAISANFLAMAEFPVLIQRALHNVAQYGNVGMRIIIQSIVQLIGVVECTSCDLFQCMLNFVCSYKI